MRRAEDRRSASVMIKSSIRWSLAGNDVDWMMNASEPRMFSSTSTKISLSAKRRTLALVSGISSPAAIAWASAGLELPATSLIEPFLADIDASPRALLDTTFSISDTCKPAGFDGRGDIRQVARLATHWVGFRCCFPCKNVPTRGHYGGALMAGIAQRRHTERTLGGCGRLHARDRRTAQTGRGRWRIRRAVDHGAEAAQAGLRNFTEHEIVGRGPGVASGLAGRFR